MQAIKLSPEATRIAAEMTLEQMMADFEADTEAQAEYGAWLDSLPCGIEETVPA